MATTIATISLTSTDLLSSALAFTSSNSLTTAGSATGLTLTSGLARTTTSYASSGVIESTNLYRSDDATTNGANKVYLKNLSTTAAEYYTIFVDEEELGRLYAGDWAFFPWSAKGGTKETFIAPIANTRAAGGLSYHDKPEDILKLLQDLAPELYRVLVPNSHLYLFCTIGAKDPKHPERYASFQNIALAMAEAGFAVRPGPLLWVKDMAYGFTPAPDSQHPYCYEGCLFARKGSRSFNGQPELDYWLIEPQTRGREHIAQKPSSLWYEVFKHSYVKDGVFLDCFCGSGGSLVTATELGMSVIGFDKDPNSIALTTDQLGEAIERKKSQDKLIVEKEEQDG